MDSIKEVVGVKVGIDTPGTVDGDCSKVDDVSRVIDV